jgi:hypothetical protein
MDWREKSSLVAILPLCFFFSSSPSPLSQVFFSFVLIMYRVEKTMNGLHSAIVVCAESREAALKAARQVLFDRPVSWWVQDGRKAGKAIVVPITCKDEPIPEVQVRRHAAARIEYMAYAKPEEGDDEGGSPFDVVHSEGHVYRMLGMFYAANDAKAYEVARERFGDALWALRAFEPLYTPSQANKRKRKTVDYTQPVVAQAEDVRKLEESVEAGERELKRLHTEIVLLKAKANETQQRVTTQIQSLERADAKAFRALGKFKLDMHPLNRQGPLQLPAAAAAAAAAAVAVPAEAEE